MINDRQQTLQRVDVLIRSAGITLKECLQEKVSQLSLLVLADLAEAWVFVIACSWCLHRRYYWSCDRL